VILYTLVGAVVALQILTLLVVLGLIRLENDEDAKVSGFRLPESEEE
jgi:hypothetical protein